MSLTFLVRNTNAVSECIKGVFRITRGHVDVTPNTFELINNGTGRFEEFSAGGKNVRDIALFNIDDGRSAGEVRRAATFSDFIDYID